jgi:acyl-coenzyme A synthetase/AMP-(fatty) acid ligase
MTTHIILVAEKLTLLWKTIPDYMVPEEVHFCGDFPLTNNAKIDVKQ